MRRRTEAASELPGVAGAEEPQPGRFAIDGATEEGVGERRGVGVLERDEVVESERRDGGRTGIPVEFWWPPIDMRSPERDGGRIELAVVDSPSTSSLRSLIRVLMPSRWGLARGIELPAMTRFLRLSSRWVSSLTRSVIYA